MNQFCKAFGRQSDGFVSHASMLESRFVCVYSKVPTLLPHITMQVDLQIECLDTKHLSDDLQIAQTIRLRDLIYET